MVIMLSLKVQVQILKIFFENVLFLKDKVRSFTFKFVTYYYGSPYVNGPQKLVMKL